MKLVVCIFVLYSLLLICNAGETRTITLNSESNNKNSVYANPNKIKLSQNSSQCCNLDNSASQFTGVVDNYLNTGCLQEKIILYGNGIATFSDFRVKLRYAQLGCSCPDSISSTSQCNQQQYCAENNPPMCQLFVALVALDDLSVCPQLYTPCGGNFPCVNSTAAVTALDGKLLAYNNYIVRSCQTETVQRFDWTLCQDCFLNKPLTIPQGGGIAVVHKYWCNSALSTNTAGFLVKGYYSYGAY